MGEQGANRPAGPTRTHLQKPCSLADRSGTGPTASSTSSKALPIPLAQPILAKQGPDARNRLGEPALHLLLLRCRGRLKEKSRPTHSRPITRVLLTHQPGLAQTAERSPLALEASFPGVSSGPPEFREGELREARRHREFGRAGHLIVGRITLVRARAHDHAADRERRPRCVRSPSTNTERHRN